METKIKDIIKNKKGIYIVISDYKNRNYRIKLTKKMLEYHNIKRVYINQKLRVVKTIKNGKVFFMITKFYK